jgi:high-affinity Fe2+/Pb2+ permease
MDTVVIRQSRKKNVGMVVVTGMFILYYFVGPYEYTRSLFAESPYFTCFLGVVFFGLFLYYLKQFIMQPAEIILSNEGIEIKNKGWNNWNYVSSFWTVAKRDSENYSETET